MNLRTIFFLPTILLIISYPVLSQKDSTHLPVPPNGVWLHSNVFIDKTEITNLSWLEYLYYLKKDSSDTDYQLALPDTLVWLSFQDTTLTNQYLRASGFKDFPVVGVTYEQVVLYCSWRSQAVNTFNLDSERRKELKIKDDQKVTFNFRLPTEKEWRAAASGSLNIDNYPYGYTSYRSKPSLAEKPQVYYEKTNKSVDYSIFKKELKAYQKSKDEPFFNVVKSFKHYFKYGEYAPRSVKDDNTRANQLGVSDMIGNVSEMVLEKGIAKGGSWMHSLEASKINKTQLYSKPEAWLGFRCACTVIVSP